jgi:hypothetical protein
MIGFASGWDASLTTPAGVFGLDYGRDATDRSVSEWVGWKDWVIKDQCFGLAT